jgi:hypothetical protein
MSLQSKLKIENLGIFTAFVFYAIVGIVCFAVLPMTDFPPHIAIIGILSLIAAYGLFRKRGWAIWFIVMLFFVATTLSVVTLYYASGSEMLLDLSMVVYLISTWVFSLYAIARRNTLKS